MITIDRTIRSLLLVVVAAVLALSGCTAIGSPTPSPTATTPTTTTPTSTSVSPGGWQQVDAAIEEQIADGPASLDNVRAVLVSVDGETKVAHYRHGFTADDHEHVWSVTKSVTGTLIGIAIEEGLIKNLDQPLSALLPEHRKAMRGTVAAVTLRQLMSMSGGFGPDTYPAALYLNTYASFGDYVDFLLDRGQLEKQGKNFVYSNVSADLAAAVLASALQRSGNGHPHTILEYAQKRLFDPLGIVTRPAYTSALTFPVPAEFRAAAFGWTTDPDGGQLGSFGLRLSAPDMIKIGELYRNRGVWNGKRIFPAHWVEEVTTPSTLEPDYGLFWWLLDTPDGSAYGAQGSYGQRIVVWPAKHAVMVTLTTTPDDATTDDVDVDRVLILAVAPALG